MECYSHSGSGHYSNCQECQSATHTLHTSTFTLPASHCEAMGWEGRVGGVRCVGGGRLGGRVWGEGVGAWPQAG